MSFASLTQTTLELIRAAVSAEHDEPPTEEEQITGFFIAEDGTLIPIEGSQVEEPDKPDIPKVGEFRGFKALSEKTSQFEQIVNFVIENGFGGSATNRTTIIDAFVNDWAVEWRKRHNIGLTSNDRRELDRLADLIADSDSGLTEKEVDKLIVQRGTLISQAQLSAVPTLEDLLNEEGFFTGLQFLPVNATGFLPPLFTSEQEVFNEDGESEGTVPLIGISNLLTGVEFIRTDVASDPTVWGTKAAVVFRDVIKANPRGAVSQQLINDAHATGFDLLSPGVIDDIFLMKLFRETPPEQEVTIPHVSMEEISARLFDRDPAPRRSSGGGGGVSRDIIFDRDQLTEQVNGRWQSWFLEGANEQRVESIIDDYVDEARAFWNGQAGKLDFDTFVSERLRQEARYQTIFRNKPGGLTEEQFIGQFQQPISSLGLRSESALTQTEAAVTSGGSPTEQLKRITRTAEFQNQGGFSQRLARTLSGLGAGAR